MSTTPTTVTGGQSKAPIVFGVALITIIIGFRIAIDRVEGQTAAKAAGGGPLYGSAACERPGNFHTAEEFHDACDAPMSPRPEAAATASPSAHETVADICHDYDALTRSVFRGRVDVYDAASIRPRLQELYRRAGPVNTSLQSALGQMIDGVDAGSRLGARPGAGDDLYGKGAQQVLDTCARLRK